MLEKSGLGRMGTGVPSIVGAAASAAAPLTMINAASA